MGNWIGWIQARQTSSKRDNLPFSLLKNVFLIGHEIFKHKNKLITTNIIINHVKIKLSIISILLITKRRRFDFKTYFEMELTLFATSVLGFSAYHYLKTPVSEAREAPLRGGSLENNNIVVTELWIYPIKSCQGIQMKDCLVTKRGFQYDREFMLINDSGRFVSQRSHPSLALISTEIDWIEKILIVTAPDRLPLRLSIEDSGRGGDCRQRCNATVWGGEVVRVFCFVFGGFRYSKSFCFCFLHSSLTFSNNSSILF